MADLITRAEFKTAVNWTTTDQDAAIDQAITWASEAIRHYADRTFDAVGASTTRDYSYDGSGVIEIDDAATITAVTMGGIALTTDDYFAQPYGEAPYSWIELPTFLRQSPEMGFTRNLDKLWWKQLTQPVIVSITGTFGWAAVPGDVKMATIWTVAGFLAAPQPYLSESIEGYSRTMPNPIRNAIPLRSRELLEPFIRYRVV